MKRSCNSFFGMRHCERDADGRAVIDMTVKNDDDFLSVFSSGSTPVISSAVADFIESSTASIPPKESLTLRIHSDCIDSDENQLYSKAFRAYYSEKSRANAIELRRNNIISTLLLAVGVLVLAFAVFLSYIVESVIWSEIIDIVAWVLIWECVDIKVFKNSELRVKKHRYRAYTSMKIEYLPEA